MNVQETKEQLIAELIRLAFAEDIGDGDHTTLCCIPATEMGKSQLIVKEDGVLAGVEMAERIFHTFDPDLKMTTFIHDGAEVKKGDIAFVVEGKVQSLLQTERLMLNVMQRMSGIATTTRKYVKALEGTKTRVLDTRKTTPGLRMVEKEAVKIGGGVNHRIGLFDMILLKDNHVDFAGGIEGKVQSLLQTERLMLNVMQRMSGIATTTRKYVKALEGTKTRVLDTRKTTPGLRMVEKEAVKIGGGVNHRIGLFDMILLKDNHVDFAGGIEAAITRCHQYLKEKNKDLKIEIEVRNFDELQEAMRVGGIDRIMLDNFNIENTKKAVEMVAGRYELESSGGITFATLRDYAECGVDYISVGALTHSVKGLDMSFKAC